MVKVISLVTASLRRKNIEEEFQKLNIEFKFFDAIDRKHARTICHQFGIKNVQGVTDGELGCFMSHLMIWQQMINENKSYVIVFEDDVVLSTQLPMLLHKADELMKKCSLLKLETMLTPVLVGKSILSINNYQLKYLKSEHLGAAGYIIRKEMANEIITEIRKSGVTKPIDHYLFNNQVYLRNDIFQLFPAAVIQDDVINKDNPNFVSFLEKERRERMMASHKLVSIKIKISATEKIKREYKRLTRQLNPITWVIKWQKFTNKKVKVPFS